MDVELTVTERHRWLGLATVAGAAFAVLTVLIRQHAPALATLDATTHVDLRMFGLDHPGWVGTMRAVTHLGDTAVVAVVDAAAVTACLVLRRRRTALFVAVAALATWVSRLALRELVGRPRPADGFWTADGLSFPSGHAANSAVMALVVTVTLWPYLGPVARRVVVPLAVMVPLAVGLSRLAGGVHWPSDVLGGVLLATAVAAAAAAATTSREPWAGSDSVIARY